MPSAARDPLAGRIPVTLITGFLGSGKTTLLSRLLRHPAMKQAAVIINEFGEVGIDHELVAASTERMALLANGCLCCSVRTDLQETLRELFVKRRAGEVIDFDRVFVETSGLADPVPVLHSLQADGLLGAQFRVDGVVTLVDAVNGPGQLDGMPEAAKQAAVADRIVITKTDIAARSAIEHRERRLAEMNRHATIVTAVNGELDPESLAGIGPASRSADAGGLRRWLGAAALDQGGSYLGERIARSSHDAAIRTFCLWFEQPFTWDTLNTALQTLTALRGPDLLRVKGIVNVAGEAGPVVLQGAQHIFHPPVTLEHWPSGERRSRIVFIVRNLDREPVEALFAAVGMLNGGRTE